MLRRVGDASFKSLASDESSLGRAARTAITGACMPSRYRVILPIDGRHRMALQKIDV